MNPAGSAAAHSSVSAAAAARTNVSPVMGEEMDQWDNILKKEGIALSQQQRSTSSNNPPVRVAFLSSRGGPVVGALGMHSSSGPLPPTSTPPSAAAPSASAPHHGVQVSPLDPLAGASTVGAAPTSTTIAPFEDDARAQLKAEVFHAIARRAGIQDAKLSSCEMDDLLDALVREYQRSNTASAGNPSPRQEGRATIVSELLWADGREAPFPSVVDAGINRPPQPFDVAAASAGGWVPRGGGNGFGGRPSSAAALMHTASQTPSSTNYQAPYSSAVVRQGQTVHAHASPQQAVFSAKPKQHKPKVRTSKEEPIRQKSETLRNHQPGKAIVRSASSAFSECSTADISSEQSHQTAHHTSQH